MRKEVGLIIMMSLVIVLVISIFILIELFDRGRVVFTDINQPKGPTVSSDDPFLGSTMPDMRLVLFSNFTCPNCPDFSEKVMNVASDYNIVLIWKNLPNDTINPQSSKASIAALCASEQNMFWQYHNLLMAQEGVLSDSIYLDLANRIGLRENAFARCLDRRPVYSTIEASIEEARRLNVTGAPTLYIGDDRFAVGTISESDLRRRLDLILNR